MRSPVRAARLLGALLMLTEACANDPGASDENPEPFNGTITGHRSIGLADISLEDIKAIKTATGTTVNDVVLAVSGGALRAYLDERGELPDSSLLATVPVSVRESSRRSGGSARGS